MLQLVSGHLANGDFPQRTLSQRRLSQRTFSHYLDIYRGDISPTFKNLYILHVHVYCSNFEFMMLYQYYVMFMDVENIGLSLDKMLATL